MRTRKTVEAKKQEVRTRLIADGYTEQDAALATNMTCFTYGEHPALRELYEIETDYARQPLPDFDRDTSLTGVE